MSQENIEIVRAIYETTKNQLHLELEIAFLAPEIEFHLSGVFPDLEPVYRGHEGMRKLNDQLNEPVRVDAFAEHGEALAAAGVEE